jgi:hypothetical protein
VSNIDFTTPKASTTLSEERGGLHELEYEVLSEVIDDKGRPRLSFARAYFLPMARDSIPVLNEVFKFWQNYAEYLLLRGENLVNGKKLFLAVKCSKRGNDVFAGRLRRKLGFFKHVKGVSFFDPKDFGPDRSVNTNLLWVTLTYDSKRCSLHKAWQNCMKEYNKFITNLRNKYGKIDVLRFIQPFPGDTGEAYGYPHFHLVLLFKEARFMVFPNLEEDEDGALKLVYRIQQRDEVKAQGKWHSFVDIKALSSVGATVNYCRKYAENVCYGSSEKAVLTSAMLWVYRKQTFCMSAGFRQSFLEFIRAMQGSKTSSMQSTLDGNVIDDWVWTCHGVRGSGEVGAVDEWFISLDEDVFHRLVDGG